MKNLFLLLFFSIFITFSFSQDYTISGFISDAGSGEKLIQATVLDLNSSFGTSSNLYGFYSFTLPKGEVQVRFSYVGYQSIIKTIKLDTNLRINIELKANSTLDEFTVVGTESEQIQERTQMSTVDVSMEKVKSLPVFLGEQDIMKTIQLLPGVQSGSEGSSGLYVRGGGPDQNLILLDGVPVYNASHLFGFFSVFNADAINSVQLIKGGFPARYGGRLSSVIDIRMKEGNQKEFHGEGSIGLIASRFSFEGPIVKDKTSFIISARRTYIDLLARPVIKAAAKSQGTNLVAGYYFYDLNAKINHKINDNNRLFLSTYAGNDKFYANSQESYTFNAIESTYDSENILKWGNAIATLRWNSIINDKLFVNTTLRYSKYNFNVGFSETSTEKGPGVDNTNSFSFNYISGIEDWSGNVDFDFVPSPNHYIKFGIGNTYHTFSPGVNQFKTTEAAGSIDTTFGSRNQYAHEASIYIEDDLKISELLKVNIGLHGSAFFVNNTNYMSFQPRFSGRYLLDETMSIKASYARMAQFLHLLTNTSIGLPTDLWVPATDRIAPQTSDQIAIGFAKTLKKQYEVSVEGYYKWMNNLIEYKDGASFFGSETDWQDKVESGRGWSYGGELLLEKKLGKTTGWIGYTLSWTNRQFDNINFGEVFPYKYDRRHDLGIAVTHKFNKKVDKKGRDKWIDVGAVFVYGTGNATTLGLERYNGAGNGSFFGNEIVHIDGRNNYRMPNYHRLDLGVNIHTKLKRGERTWSFGLYNAYSRQNPFYLFFGFENNERVLKQISLFPILPSFSYNFKF
ncbi:TonB-dependent receptor [Flavobacteriales bacterium]|nr:TonB-dependent receptor [Flavobacteriales bacterium]